MTTTLVTDGLRRSLLLVVGVICLGTMVELWFMEHMEETLQLTPFVLCTLGILTVEALLWRPQHSTLLAFRVVMLLLVFGSLLGIYLHISGNYGFELEIQPNATTREVLMETLRGANPILAPGILALAATIGLLATHAPADVREQQPTLILETER